MSSLLFSPLSIGSLSLENRILVSPMCQYAASDGLPSDWHLMHYGALAQSGAGLLRFEATAVTPEGRITPRDLGLWSAEHEAALAGLVQRLRRWSPIRLGVQIGHAGRKASTDVPWKGGAPLSPAEGGWRPEAPSAAPHFTGAPMPEAMKAENLAGVRAAFVAAAERAARIGFDVVEVHMAHGYLLHEFLSPVSNRREDEYGGSLENRMRFPLEVFEAVRAALPVSLPVGVRISGSDWVDGGWDLEMSAALAVILQQKGCAFIDVSGGGLSLEQRLTVGPAYQCSMAARVKRELAAAREQPGTPRTDALPSGGNRASMQSRPPMPVGAVGLITEPETAEALLISGQADMISLGRAMLYDPRWPWHAAAKLGASATAAPRYLRAVPHGLKGLFNT